MLNIPPIESKEESKQERRLKIKPPQKLLTRLPISLRQIKAGDNSYKLKTELKKTSYLMYQQNT